MSRITALIPAYNEELSIGSVVISTNNYVDQIIVVDDGSADKTADIAAKAGATVINHIQNMGKGAALKTGFEAVGDADIIVTIDSDGQHNPDEIPKLLKPIEDGEADIVNGSRYLDSSDDETPSYRRLGQTILDTATNLNSGLKITDSQSGFRAFAAHTVPAFRFTKSDFSIESEMLMDAASKDFKIKEVQIGVTYNNGQNGSIHTKNPVSHGLGVLVKVLQDMEFRRPLYYFTIPGLLLIATGLILGLFYFGAYMDNRASFFPTVLAGIIGLGGMFLSFTGIILHTIIRLMERNEV